MVSSFRADSPATIEKCLSTAFRRDDEMLKAGERSDLGDERVWRINRIYCRGIRVLDKNGLLPEEKPKFSLASAFIFPNTISN